MIKILSKAKVAKFWPLLAPMLARALVRGPASHTSDNVLQEVEAGELTVFVAQQENQFIGVAFVEIDDTPWERCCSVAWLAGNNFRLWIGPLQRAIEFWARLQGCTALEGRGRRGWQRATDLKPVATIFRKEL